MCDLEAPPSYCVKTCKIIYKDEIHIYFPRIHRVSTPNTTTKWHLSATCNKFSICIEGLKIARKVILYVLKEGSRRNQRRVPHCQMMLERDCGQTKEKDKSLYDPW